MAETDCRVSVCSPAHNEEGNVEQLIARVDAVMRPRFGSAWEQIIVDDGSNDRTAAIVESCAQSNSAVRLIRHGVNRGECPGWKTAFDAAKGEVVVLLAADLQSPPEEIPRLLDEVLVNGFDVGTARRVRRKDGMWYWAATRVLTQYMKAAFDVHASDVSSSFFAVRSEFVKDLPLERNDHRYILAAFRRRGARISEVPCAHAARIAGASHYRKSKIFRAVPELVEFTARWRNGHFDR